MTGSRLSQIAAHAGDHGQTGLDNGLRVDKDNPVIQALGAVDELNSWIGVVIALSGSDKIRSFLSLVQHDLCDLGAQIRGPGTQRLSPDHLARLEMLVAALNSEFGQLKEPILPGGVQSAAFAHVARTVCRRAERDLFTLFEAANRFDGLPLADRPPATDDFGLPYLNRLSDLLFVVSRFENCNAGQTDVMWRREQSLRSYPVRVGR
ncbi:cob(I)alamin adenosyltransferase [Methylobacterium brachiatum]|uniref:Corrinoid adenosyltransferase n=1 Tax=Methylobacterium brachiatum TaxID=269660 RepID=A0AAJ1TT34_9HYPH|nr:cob(I)yrinic acid a,c-diamide adenosyltransferase [Methylobacterium brachiatum]MCB4806439.1 cob(I)yrinic acid a,c-diamide adenosyltransferase [Methylobacterium brachiatum]MDQ0546667.1 cob(I)alamin adenosyltransferase [Methylobacterium brachiatum]